MKGHHDRNGKFVVDHHRLFKISSDSIRPGSREATLAGELYSSKMNRFSGRNSAKLRQSSRESSQNPTFPAVIHYKLKDLILPDNEYIRPKTSRNPKSILCKFPKYQTRNSKQREAQKVFVTNALTRLGDEKKDFVIMRRDIEHMISYNGSLECASVVEDNCNNGNNIDLIKWDRMYDTLEKSPIKKVKSRPQSTSTVAAVSSSSAPSLLMSSKSVSTHGRKLPRVASTSTDGVSATISLGSVAGNPIPDMSALQLQTSNDDDDDDVEYL